MESDMDLDAFDLLAVAHKPKSRLKTSIDIGKLTSSEPIVFELDNDDLAFDDDDEDDGLDNEAYNRGSLSEESRSSQKTGGESFAELAKTHFFPIPNDFANVTESMKSISGEDKIMKEIIRVGDGKKVPNDGKIFLHYMAAFEGADDPFDSTILRRVPHILDMRKADALPGFLLAVQSMEVHEVAMFVVNWQLAYGEFGCAPRIPPKADIIYMVEVLRVLDGEMLKSPLYMTGEERAILPFSDILSAADKLRTKGNGCFRNGIYHDAVRHYRRAATLLEEYSLPGARDEVNRNQLLHTLYSNSAQCYLQLDQPAKACISCKLGLRSAKGFDSIKLLYRFARAKFMLEDFQGCIGMCDRILKLDKDNSDAIKLRREASDGSRKEEDKSKAMYKAMFQ